ncbi:MAG: ATP-binding cassette domain-containing protein, partial [Pseudomonadota bacterium]|nr:ATP-binding cassette domain-containing protein [Pseudomonadota bacterium]
MTEDNDIISIQNLNKWFGNFHVLRDINLTVRSGEKIVICGPSGSGKSTLIRCINRLEVHQEGEIIVNGVRLDGSLKNLEEVRSEVGMLFQQFNLFPHLSILENLTLGPVRARGMAPMAARELAEYYLERVRIPEQMQK